MFAFLHERSYISIKEENCLQRCNDGNCRERTVEGLRIDTCANRTSVVSKCQYDAYCQTLNLPSITDSSGNKVVKGVGGSSNVSWFVVIQLPFKYLDIIIYIAFLVIEEYVRPLLSIKNMFAGYLQLAIDWMSKHSNFSVPLFPF